MLRERILIIQRPDPCSGSSQPQVGGFYPNLIKSQPVEIFLLHFPNSFSYFGPTRDPAERAAYWLLTELECILKLMAHKDIQGGRRLAELRVAKGLSMRDVFELSQELATIEHNTDFLVPPSRLSDIESKGVIPSICRLYVLSIAYGCTVRKVTKFYGLDIGSRPIPRQKIRVVTEKRQRTPLRVPSKLAPETRVRVERLLFQTEFTQSEIAHKCGISQAKVGTIAREIGFAPRMRKSKRISRVQSREQKARDRQIIQLIEKGKTYREVGQRYGITRQRAQQIVRLYGG
jgi:transcriptional regulator with XRE-family HTH domain